MQISSLVSLLSSTIRSLDGKIASRHSAGDITLQSSQSGSFLTFYQNNGAAALCPSIDHGYRSFDSTAVSGSSAYYFMVPNDESLMLQAIPTSVDNYQFYEIVVGNSQISSNLTFSISSSGDVTPYVNSQATSFFYDDSNFIDESCYPLLVGYSGAGGYDLTDLHT